MAAGITNRVWVLRSFREKPELNQSN